MGEGEEEAVVVPVGGEGDVVGAFKKLIQPCCWSGLVLTLDGTEAGERCFLLGFSF